MNQKKITIASGRKYGASLVRALQERSMLDPNAPDAIVFTSDCCYETHSPREACKKDEAGKHLRMEAVVSRLGGETSHLDDGNVPIQTEACSKKLAVFPTTEQGWVRTDIRTPEGYGLYNVAWFNNVEFNVCSAIFDGGKWYADEAQLFPHEVVAWMPMPEYEPMSEVKEILAVEDEIGIASKTAQLTDIELQDEIDTFNHVCQYLAEQGRPDEDLLARLEKLEAEQRRRK